MKTRIDTQRCIIRPFELNDLSDLYEILNDPEVMKACEPVYSLEKTKAFLEDFCISRHGAKACMLKDSHKVIGYLLFNEIEERTYEIGWFFNRKFWHQGLAYEAAKALINYAFDALDAKCVFAETCDLNKSLNLMKKLNMKPSSTIDAADSNLIVYEIRKDDVR